MKISDVIAVQSYYPQIYLACHVQHIRASSTVHSLSSHDSALLIHLHPELPVTPTKLALHMGLKASTISGAITRLGKLGYIKRQPQSHDGRVIGLTLTPEGGKAMTETSVLDGKRVAAMLSRLTPADRKRALKGLHLLAKASTELMTRQNKRER